MLLQGVGHGSSQDQLLEGGGRGVELIRVLDVQPVELARHVLGEAGQREEVPVGVRRHDEAGRNREAGPGHLPEVGSLATGQRDVTPAELTEPSDLRHPLPLSGTLGGSA
ncbi:hypothetical protein D3C72_2166150 [compost metagenome]